MTEVKLATLEWVEWFDTTRLHSSIGDITPDEYEALYHAQHQSTAGTNP
ncbi:hypothetical protein [Sphaerisporangium sp. NPDC051011]